MCNTARPRDDSDEQQLKAIVSTTATEPECLDIEGTALFLAERLGDDAILWANEYTRKVRDAGNVKGYTAWLKIAKAIESRQVVARPNA